MKLRTTSLAIALFGVLSLFGCGAPRTAFEPGQSTVLVNGRGLALDGYDPVAYFEDGSPRRGLPELEAPHAGATYRFATAAHRGAFLADPERYLPAYGGWCAWAVADGQGSLVEVDPESFLVQDGRLLLFYDGLMANTRAWWLERDADSLLQAADEHWQRLEASAVSSPDR